MRYFIDEINVIIDGKPKGIISIGGAAAYNPNRMKANALERIKKYYPDSQIALVTLIHKEVSLEEYNKILHSSPPWLGNIGS